MTTSRRPEPSGRPHLGDKCSAHPKEEEECRNFRFLSDLGRESTIRIRERPRQAQFQRDLDHPTPCGLPLSSTCYKGRLVRDPRLVNRAICLIRSLRQRGRAGGRSDHAWRVRGPKVEGQFKLCGNFHRKWRPDRHPSGSWLQGQLRGPLFCRASGMGFSSLRLARRGFGVYDPMSLDP